MVYKTLFIDFDDTLWDTSANSRKAMESLFRDSMLASLYADFDHFFDLYLPLNEKLWNAYHHHQVTKEELVLTRFHRLLLNKGINNKALALELNSRYLCEVAQQTLLIPFARELMDYLSARYHTVMLSNGFGEVQYTKLARSGLEPYFNHVILSDDVGVNKPHAEIFEYALKQCCTPVEQVLMVGDNFDADIIGAHNVGIDQLFFNPKGQTNLPFKPTYEVFRLDQILKIV